GDLDVVRVADVELDVLADELGAEADADDLEPALVPLRQALDHVGRERPVEAVQRAGPPFVVLTPERDLAALDRDLDRGIDPLGQLRIPLGQGQLASVHGRGDPVDEGNRLLSDARHGYLPGSDQYTEQRNSPPTRSLRASRSDITPFGVDTIAAPRPPRTFGRSAEP